MAIVTGYIIDPITKQFLEERTIETTDENTFSDILFMENMVFVTPPATDENSVAIWENNNWVVYPKEYVDGPTRDFIKPVWNGSQWVEGATLEEAKQYKKDEITQKRYEEENSSVTLENGIIIRTDKISQSVLASAMMIAKEDPTYTVNWKGANGWITLDASGLLEVATIVRQHVQSCFDKEKSLHEQIDACTTMDEVKAIQW